MRATAVILLLGLAAWSAWGQSDASKAYDQLFGGKPAPVAPAPAPQAAEQPAAAATELAAVEQESADVGEQLTALEKKVDELVLRLGRPLKPVSSYSTVERRLEDIEKRLSKIEKLVDQVDNRVKKLEAKK